MNNLEILKNADNSVKTFTLENMNKVCKIVDIYDGDTCRAVFEHNGEINKWTIRMNGYD